MPAAEVAIAVGLTDQSHLTRAFTQRYGITPVRIRSRSPRHAQSHNILPDPFYTADNGNDNGCNDD